MTMRAHATLTFDGVIVLLDDAAHAALLAAVVLLLRGEYCRLVLVASLLQCLQYRARRLRSVIQALEVCRQ